MDLYKSVWDRRKEARENALVLCSHSLALGNDLPVGYICEWLL